MAKIANGVGPISRDGEAALVALGDRRRRPRRCRRRRRQDSRAISLSIARSGLHSYVTGPGGIAADLEHVAEDAGKTLLFATLGPRPAACSCSSTGRRSSPRSPARRRQRLPRRERDRLPADRGGPDHRQRRGHAAAARADLRRRHGLLAAAGPPLPRGAWRKGKRPADALPRPMRESVPAIAASDGNGDRGDARPAGGGTGIDPLAGPGPRDRRRDDARRLFHPAAGAARRCSASAPFGWRRHHGGRALDRYPDETSTAVGDSRWRRVADLVRRRPRAIVATVLAALALLSLGNLVEHGTIGFGQGEIGSTESSRGTEVLDEHFPPGLGSPLTAVVDARGNRAGAEGAEAARRGQADPAGAAGAELRGGGSDDRPARRPLLRAPRPMP